tara:strand:+ start:144 stop:251 length:108 start_codon:yes stop_codon:yes gene_type:complete
MKEKAPFNNLIDKAGEFNNISSEAVKTMIQDVFLN